MNKITVNFMTAEITVSKAFYKRASIYDTPEYISLRKAMVENPSFKIVIAESNKRTYGKLTFERMESYIKTQPNSEEMLNEFAKVQEIAKAKGSAYPSTKRWFLQNYPQFKSSDIIVHKDREEITADEFAECA